MSIAGTSDTLGRLLTLRLRESGGLDGFTVAAMSSRDVRPNLQNRVGVLLYRVGVDRTRRHIDLPRLATSAPARTSLGVELHYMLVIWGGNSAEGEPVMLGRCMQILDAQAVPPAPPSNPPGTPQPPRCAQPWRMW